MMDQLNHLIDSTFSDVEKFESSNRRHTLQSLYAALDHQLQDGLMARHAFDRMRYIVRKLFDLKQQIHAIEAELSLPLPADVIGHTFRGYTCKVVIRYSSMLVLFCGALQRPAYIL